MSSQDRSVSTAESRRSGGKTLRARLAPVFLACGILAPGLGAQVDPPPRPTDEEVTVVPGARYQAGGLFTSMMGQGYRRLWTTPIRVPVADLGSLGGGGLTPFRVGGGTTTQTLHLRGADGRRYVLRSVNKSPRALAEEFQDTPVEAIVQDQMSSFHPSGAVVVAGLLEAVGVLHPEPRLVVIPDDPRLAEFRSEFAGMLALFEERPDDLPDGQAGFAGSRRIIQTDDLFDELEEDPRNRVELRELLKSRLVDLLVGDRDRSVNNYLWARFPDTDDGYIWRPIPRDRDQAFVQFDGFLKGLARFYEPRLVRFGSDYPDIKALTRNAWDIDRNLLVGLDRATWNATVQEVTAAITDDVIAESVSRMPTEHYALVGPASEAKLRARRDELPMAARRFYDIVFQYADIHATDTDEVAIIERVDGGDVRIVIYARGPSSEPQGSPHFERTFSPGETREVRLYMHGGDDLIRVESSTDLPITIRAVGSGGRDELVNSTGSKGVVFYDAGDGTVTHGGGTKLVRERAPRPYAWFEGSRQLDWGTESQPAMRMSFDGDRGLVVGIGIQQDRHGFLSDPYSSRLQLRAAWAFGRSQPILDYRQYFRGLFGSGGLELRARFSGIEVVDFYGLGNETTRTEPSRFYKVDQKQLLLRAALSFGDGERRELSIGPVVKRTSSDTTGTATFVADNRPYGAGTFVQVGLQASLQVDGRDHQIVPTRGYYLSGGASYYPAAIDLESSFGEVHGEVATFLSPGGGNPTLALRVGGKQVWGTFPYYEAAFIGGSDNVRGLREQRFAGDASVYGNAELRVFVTRFFLLFPADFGVFGLSDLGRVYSKGQPSSKWHTSLGAGIWLAPVTRSGAIHLAIAESEGRKAFYLGLGFAF